MADVFTIDPMSPVGAPAPVLTGGYYPSIDQQMINGMGIIIPWGGGSLQRAMLSSGEAVGAPVTPENKFLSMMATFMPAGDIYNYNFEGLIGPPGPPGPMGPQGVPALPTLGPSGIGVPVRTLDDGATPATVTGLNATAAIQYVVLKWTANSETDMDHYEIWRHTSDASGSASKIAEAYQTMMADGGLTAGQIYYYWVKAVDHLGNTSGFPNSVNATPFDVRTVDIELLAIDTAQIAAGAIEEAKIAAAAVTAAKLEVAGLDGTTGDVAANHIVANMLQTNCVTSAKIQADAVTATKIYVAGLDGESGKIVVADVTDANTVTGGINSYATTLIGAGKIVISGATNLDDWADTTYIAGGMIATGSIIGNKILQTGETGLFLNADRILISGEVLLSNWAHGTAVTKIDGGEIECATLSAINANLGTITAGDITALTISADRLTVGTLLADRINQTSLAGITTPNTRPFWTIIESTSSLFSSTTYSAYSITNEYMSPSAANEKLAGVAMVQKQDDASYTATLEISLYDLDEGGDPATLPDYSLVTGSEQTVVAQTGDDQYKWITLNYEYDSDDLTVGQHYRLATRSKVSNGANEGRFRISCFHIIDNIESLTKA